MSERPENQSKEVGGACQEEGRQEDGRAQQGSQARRGRARQDRLAALSRPWWERDPAALAAEIEELTRAGLRVHHDQATGGRLALIAESESESFRIVFHHAPRPSGERLLAFAPASVDTRASRFVPGEGTAREAIEELRSTGGRTVWSFDDGCVVLPAFWSAGITGAGGVLVLGRSRLGAHGYAGRALTGSREGLEASTQELRAAFPDEVRGLWTRGDLGEVTDMPLERVVSTAEQILAERHGVEAATIRARLRREVGAVVQSPRGPEHQARWTFVRRGSAGEPYVLNEVHMDALAYRARAPFARTLETKRVTLIGCGAVGWTVAQQLVRAGVRHFTLYDDDLVWSYNLARLATYLPSAGRPKSSALAEELAAVAPGVEVQPWAFEVGSHVGVGALVDDQPDVLINLTGEEMSTDETNIAALRLRRPAIFAWVSNGVAAGRIFRVRPFDTACYECVRTAEPEPIDSRGIVPRGPEIAWDGANFNTDAFAAAVSRMVVLTLTDEAVTRRNPDHVVLTFGGVVPSSRIIEIPRDHTCRACR